MCHGYPMLVSHETIRSGKIIRNGSFVIRCEIHFKIELDKLTINKITKKRTVDGITWWIQYYPSGLQSTDKGYISVYFYVEGGPIKADFSCAMSIGDDIIQKRVSEACEKCDNWGDNKWFSHKQCQIANHNNDVIDLVCQITFTKPFPTPQNDSTLLQSVNKITKTCIEDAVTFTILECQLELNEVGDFDSTPKKFAERSGRHQWRILYFPAGDLNRSKGHISLHIEASTTEAETVILSGVIKIDGTPFEKKFKMFVENEDSSLAFSKLITHEELRGIGGIINNQIVFICEVLFET
uniref:MATH domain-containing protein n=1 Tax=Panagrellus redivivus TaxID=6233 RepID=A0A7E4VDN4_PANRE